MTGLQATYVCGEQRSIAAKPTIDRKLRRCDACVAGAHLDQFYRSIDEANTGEDRWRWRVEWETGELTEIANEKLSSQSTRAVAMKGSVLCARQEDVRWLHATLGELIAFWDKVDT